MGDRRRPPGPGDIRRRPGRDPDHPRARHRGARPGRPHGHPGLAGPGAALQAADRRRPRALRDRADAGAARGRGPRAARQPRHLRRLAPDEGPLRRGHRGLRRSHQPGRRGRGRRDRRARPPLRGPRGRVLGRDQERQHPPDECRAPRPRGRPAVSARALVGPPRLPARHQGQQPPGRGPGTPGRGHRDQPRAQRLHRDARGPRQPGQRPDGRRPAPGRQGRLRGMPGHHHAHRLGQRGHLRAPQRRRRQPGIGRSRRHPGPRPQGRRGRPRPGPQVPRGLCPGPRRPGADLPRRARYRRRAAAGGPGALARDREQVPRAEHPGLLGQRPRAPGPLRGGPNRHR
ncbi:hypothetical protein D3C72_906760 [compost metagenome]